MRAGDRVFIFGPDLGAASVGGGRGDAVVAGVLLHALKVVWRGHVADVRRHAVGADGVAAGAGVAGFGRCVCGGLDRPVHRAQDRGQEAVFL